MTVDDGIEDEHWKDKLDALNAQVTKQGAHVRQLKKDGAPPDDIAEAVTALQALKLSAESLHKEYSKEETFNRKFFDDMILRRMFVVPAFEIHGGVRGLYDLGPPACALKVNIHA
jgi:glycyl-tRNA synthetase